MIVEGVSVRTRFPAHVCVGFSCQEAVL
jgi:hypothetical protein